MRALVVCQYFAPEIGAPQARWSEMAREWASEGADVQVLTGMPNHPTGVVHEGYRGKFRATEHRDGYEIHRCWLYATPNEGFIKKTMGHLSFMITGVLLGWPRVRMADVVVVSSPTFFSILTAWIYAKRFRAPLVVEIRDLWPGVFVELGVLTNRTLIKLLERLELAAYRAASRVVVVTEGFRADLVGRGVPADKVDVVTNGVDVHRFRPQPPNLEVRASLGVSEREILVLYLGAHGISHALRSVLDAADQLRRQSDGLAIRFIFIGEGAEKGALRSYAGELGLDNVTMLDGVPRDEVPAILAAADIGLVPLRDVPLFKTFIPSKMFEFLSAGLPVIGSVAGEAAQILKQAGATVVPPETPDALANAIIALATSADQRTHQRKLGREFVEAEYDRAALARRYLDILRSTVASEPR